MYFYDHITENGVVYVVGDDLFGQLGRTTSLDTTYYGDTIHYATSHNATSDYKSKWNIGITQDQNQAQIMEDSVVAIQNFGGNSSQLYIAVMDGHGWKAEQNDVTKFLSDTLHKVIPSRMTPNFR
jgi:hypothetical protein